MSRIPGYSDEELREELSRIEFMIIKKVATLIEQNRASDIRRMLAEREYAAMNGKVEP